MNAPAAPRCALWLLPPPALRVRLGALIDRLAARCHAPRFTPHVTLRSRIHGAPAELAKRAALLADALAPVELRFTRLAHSGEFHRCLFVLIGETVSLAAARATASRWFGLDPGGFTPHASLLYASLPEAERARLLAELNEAFELSVRATEMALWLVEGLPEAWRELGCWALGGREAA